MSPLKSASASAVRRDFTKTGVSGGGAERSVAFSQQHADVVTVVVGSYQVEDAIAVEIAGGDEIRFRVRVVVGCGAEGPVAVPECDLQGLAARSEATSIFPIVVEISPTASDRVVHRQNQFLLKVPSPLPNEPST